MSANDTTEATPAELTNWRALVRREARNAQTTAEEIGQDDLELQERWLETAAELNRMGDWLDSLVGVEMRVKTNGHGRVRGSD